MIYMIMIGLALVLVALSTGKKESSVAFLAAASGQDDQQDTGYKAVNVKLLTDEPFKVRIRVALENLRARLGDHLFIKGLLFVAAATGIAIAVNHYLYGASPLILTPVIALLLALVVAKGLQVYERRAFDDSFPNALNLLNGAVSSGESLMHAIIYVGNSLDGPVGHEFKLMGQRLRLGQPAEEVLSKSCHRFPYAPFYFFTITLRANISRGGQLKDIIKRLNRVMFNSRTIEKKKGAMTAEARMSVKIVASIPLFFMAFMYYMSPENFNFVFNDPDGRSILYYVLASECMGIAIIWLLMRRTQA